MDAYRENEDQNQLQGADRARVLPVSITPKRKTNSLFNQGNIEEGGRSASKFQLPRLGLEDFFSLQVWRASVAELIGMIVLVFLIDTLVISSIETNTKTPNVLISCSVALAITMILLATGPISGGHVNPAISLAAAFAGLISFSRAMIYIMAQCLGAILGALALKAVVSSSISSQFSLGGCTLKVAEPGLNGPVMVGIGTSQALWLEIFSTFIFLFPVTIAFDHRQAKAIGPVVLCSIIGVVVGLIVFITSTVPATKGYSGAGINPARCFRPAIVRGGHLWTGHWVFWVGPGISCIAFHLYSVIIPREHFTARINKD